MYTACRMHKIDEHHALQCLTIDPILKSLAWRHLTLIGQQKFLPRDSLSNAESGMHLSPWKKMEHPECSLTHMPAHARVLVSMGKRLVRTERSLRASAGSDLEGGDPSWQVRGCTVLRLLTQGLAKKLTAGLAASIRYCARDLNWRRRVFAAGGSTWGITRFAASGSAAGGAAPPAAGHKQHLGAGQATFAKPSRFLIVRNKLSHHQQAPSAPLHARCWQQPWSLAAGSTAIYLRVRLILLMLPVEAGLPKMLQVEDFRAGAQAAASLIFMCA